MLPSGVALGVVVSEADALTVVNGFDPGPGTFDDAQSSAFANLLPHLYAIEAIS